MLSGNCTEALPIQANVMISGSSAKLIKNGIAPLPFPLPALLNQYWYIRRGERVRVRRHAAFYATIGLTELRLDRSADFSPLPGVLGGLEGCGLKSALLNSIAVLPVGEGQGRGIALMFAPATWTIPEIVRLCESSGRYVFWVAADILPARRKWRVVREGASASAPAAGRQDAALYGSQDGRRYAARPHGKHILRRRRRFPKTIMSRFARPLAHGHNHLA